MLDIRVWPAIGFALVTTITTSTSCARPVKPLSVPDEKTTMNLTRAFASEFCFFDEAERGKSFLGALGSAVLPSLIKVSIDRLTTAVKKAADKNTTSVFTHANVEMSTDDIPACIQVIKGDFYLRENKFPPDKKEILAPFDTDDLKYIGAYLANPPEYFFEGRVVLAESDKSVITIAPTAMIYNKPFLKGKKGARDIVISFAISEPGKPGDHGEGNVGKLTFRNINAETTYGFDVYNSERRIVSAVGTPWIPVSLTSSKKARTISIAVTETKDANKFLAFVSDVLAGSKDNVETLLKQQLIASEKLKVQQEERKQYLANLEEQTKAVSARIDAVVSAREAIAKLENTSGEIERAKAAADVVKRILEVDLASEKADLESPFTEQDLNKYKAIAEAKE